MTFTALQSTGPGQGAAPLKADQGTAGQLIYTFGEPLLWETTPSAEAWHT